MFNQEAAFVPGCEYDVFVSYARDDNDWPTPPDKLADGWVHKFRDTLHSFLNQKTRRSGGRVRFFFDTQAIRQHEDFLPQVAEAVRKSAVMIVLISDAWIGSEVCQNELNLFHQGPACVTTPDRFRSRERRCHRGQFPIRQTRFADRLHAIVGSSDSLALLRNTHVRRWLADLPRIPLVVATIFATTLMPMARRRVAYFHIWRSSIR